jgi:pimeloyl-ACP methyl ester carboxylesterase
MPDALIRGVTLHYLTFGESGPWISLTPGSRRGHEELVPMARALAERGHRVLLHDRRNCGASEVSVEPLGSENEIWADDLRELARQVGAERLWVGGSSSGARLAILFALRHPDALEGLLLWRVTGGQHAAEKLAKRYYADFAEAAAEGGMAQVAETEHFKECIAARPANREALLRMDRQRFIDVMRSWYDSFIRDANMPAIGATEEQLRGIAVPTCIIAGNDVVHTPMTARRVASLIPRAELHDDVVPKRPDDALLQEWDRAEWRAAEPSMVAIFTALIRSHSKV